MLQNMQQKVTEEGEKQQQLYDKFMCYCQTNSDDLAKSIEDAKAKIDTLEGNIEGNQEKKQQSEESLSKHKEGRENAKAAIAEANAVRKKEAAAFASESADLKTNLASMGKAIKAIEGGMKNSFVQTKACSAVRKFAMEKAEIDDATRERFLSFFSDEQEEEGSDSSNAPGSGEIVGIMKQMNDEMTKNLAAITSDEEAGIKDFESMMSAKNKEKNALSVHIEEEEVRVGGIKVELASMTSDLEDTQEALSADEKFQAELASTCKTKTKEWEDIKKTRSQELAAIADTIKILNDDDALALFKKSLPSDETSLLQVQVNRALMASRARALLREAHRRFGHHKAQLDLIGLAIEGKKVGFDKVLQMIDDMVSTLKTEQEDDDKKKEYCEKEFDSSDDKRKALEHAIADSQTTVEDLQSSLDTVDEEIKALEDGIKSLDKSVAEATEQRKKENAEYKESKAIDTRAKELLKLAKNRLSKFYTPKLVSFVERHTYEADAGDSAMPKAPSIGNYEKKHEENAGVMQMIRILITDLEKDMKKDDLEEKDAQEDYEKLMEDAKEKRAEDAKAIGTKKSSKAAEEEMLQAAQVDQNGKKKSLAMTKKYIASLHTECDWLLKYFDVRKDARADEVDALQKAKAVLNGADYSLLQISRPRTLLRRK